MKTEKENFVTVNSTDESVEQNSFEKERKEEQLVMSLLYDYYKRTIGDTKLGFWEVYVSPTGMANKCSDVGDASNVRYILHRLCEKGYLTLLKKGWVSQTGTSKPRLPLYRIEFGVLILDTMNNKVVKQKSPYKIVDTEWFGTVFVL